MVFKEKGEKTKRRSVSKPHPNYKHASLPCYIDCLYDRRDDGFATSHMHWSSRLNKIVLKQIYRNIKQKNRDFEYPEGGEGRKEEELKPFQPHIFLWIKHPKIKTFFQNPQMDYLRNDVCVRERERKRTCMSMTRSAVLFHFSASMATAVPKALLK